MKRPFIILIVCIIFAIIAGVVFAFLNKSSQEPSDVSNVFPISLFYPNKSPEPTNGNNMESEGNYYSEEYEFGSEGEYSYPKPVRLSNEEIYSYWIVKGATTTAASSTKNIKNSVYFLTKDGGLKKNDGTGEFSLLSHSYGIPLEVEQNTDGTAAAIRFDSGFVYVYQTERNAWDLLGDGISDMAFSPDGTEILAVEERGGETSLVQYEPFSSPKKTTIILKFSGTDFRVQWPDNNSVILTSPPSYSTNGDAWKINLQNKTFSKIINKAGLGVLASTLDAHLLVFSSETKAKTATALYASDGSLVNSYSRMLMEPKCGASLSSPAAFCGAPQLIPSGTFVFPDDYLKRKVFTHDELVRISFTDGEMTAIPFQSDSYVDMSKIRHENGTVYFVNRLDDILYGLDVTI